MFGTESAPALSSGAPPWKGGGGGSNLSAGRRSRVVESAKRTLDTEHGAVQSQSRGEDLFHLLLVPARAANGPARSVSRATRRPLLGSIKPSQSISHAGALVGDYQGLLHDGAMLRGWYRPVPEGPRDIRSGCHRHRRPGGRPLISSCISRRKPEKTAHLSPERVTKRPGRQAHRTGPRGPKRSPASARTLRGHDRHLM